MLLFPDDKCMPVNIMIGWGLNQKPFDVCRVPGETSRCSRRDGAHTKAGTTTTPSVGLILALAALVSFLLLPQYRLAVYAL